MLRVATAAAMTPSRRSHGLPSEATLTFFAEAFLLPWPSPVHPDRIPVISCDPLIGVCLAPALLNSRQVLRR